jgi:hypothetical protein
MMLEGHFIVMALSEQYRGDEYLLYDIWRFTRGLTAPLFFTVSGLVFTYLLVKNNVGFFKNKRVNKGVKRSFKLILWGYALQLNLFYLIQGEFSGYAYIFHVLQCIGASLLTVILIYGVYKLIRVIPLYVLLGIAGTLGFILKPTIYALDFSGVHPIIENMLVVTSDERSFKSIFALFPWVGFALFGGMIGAFVSKRPHKVYTNWFPITLLGIGLVLNIAADPLLSFVQPLFIWLGVKPFVGLGYLFARFGQVLFVLALIILTGKYKRKLTILYYRKLSFLRSWSIPIGFAVIGFALVIYALTVENPNLLSNLTLNAFGQFLIFIGVAITSVKLIQWNYDLFIKIGQNTLSIYIIHVMILYAGLFGFGINKLLHRALDPWFAIVCAIGFVLFFTYFVKYIEPINKFYKGIIPFKKLNRKKSS